MDRVQVQCNESAGSCEIKGCLLKQERAKGKQWKALWSVIRVAVGAFKSLNEVWCNFISVPGQKGQQVGCTESLSGDEGRCHLQPNKQLDAPSQTPASVMDEDRCLNMTAVIFCVVAFLRFSLSLCAFQVDFQTCVCKHSTGRVRVKRPLIDLHTANTKRHAQIRRRGVDRLKPACLSP